MGVACCGNDEIKAGTERVDWGLLKANIRTPKAHGGDNGLTRILSAIKI